MHITYNNNLKGYMVKYGKSLIAVDKNRSQAIIKAINRLQTRYFKAKKV